MHYSLKLVPFSRILRFNSSKNIKFFFKNLKRFQSLQLLWSRLISVVHLGYFVNSHCSFNTSPAWRTESVFSISRKIIIKTFLKYLMFVRKRQAILKQVWSCSGRMPRAWAYSNLESWGRFSEYCNPERPSSLKCKLRRSLCFSRKSELIGSWCEYDSTSAQKSKFLNNYQIFFKEFDENSFFENIYHLGCK